MLLCIKIDTAMSRKFYPEQHPSNELWNEHKKFWGCPRGVMVKAMDCRIVVSEFVLQSSYYIHFRANTLGKGMNPLILPAMG